jgi:hypothetical protein
MINAGHRRGAKAGRCLLKGKLIVTEELPAFCAVALAGLGDLPDTILTRAVILKMRRRAPTERIEPYRRRVHAPEGHRLRDRLAEWAVQIRDSVNPYPSMPDGITDRAADVWEALLSVADVAGGDWPERARAAAVTLVTDAMVVPPSLGVRLLADLKIVFGDKDAVSTVDLLSFLVSVDEAPWGDLKGKPLEARRLAKLLKPYGVSSKTIRIGTETVKGYTRESFWDAWVRYLPQEKDNSYDPHLSPSRSRVTPVTKQTETGKDDVGQPHHGSVTSVTTVMSEPSDQDELVFEEDESC